MTIVLLGMPAGYDVNFRRDKETARGGRRVECCTSSNTRRTRQGAVKLPKETRTRWTVVLGVKPAGDGTEQVHDNVTDMAIFALQRTTYIVPAGETSHVIQMARQCRRSGPSPSSMSAEGVPT